MTTNQLNSTWSADWRPTDFPFSDDRHGVAVTQGVAVKELAAT